MAAFNKLGGLLRHSALASSVAASSSPALFNAARLMSTKLFVGGLSWGVDDVKLRDAFSSFGEVAEARVITDRDTGRSRGFGFVNYTNSDDANAAISGMDGKASSSKSAKKWSLGQEYGPLDSAEKRRKQLPQEIDGRPVRVNIANDRPTGNRGGGGYGGGGFGGGGYGGGNQSYGGGY